MKQAIRNGIIITTTKCCLKKGAMLYINNKDEWKETPSLYRFIWVRKYHHSWGIYPRSIKLYTCEHIREIPKTSAAWKIYLGMMKSTFVTMWDIFHKTHFSALPPFFVLSNMQPGHRQSRTYFSFMPWVLLFQPGIHSCRQARESLMFQSWTWKTTFKSCCTLGIAG